MGGYYIPAPPPPADYRSPYPYSGGYANPNTSQTKSMGFNPHGNEADIDPDAAMEDIYAANRDTINTTGNLLGQEAGNQLNYYQPIQQQYQGAATDALNRLNQTPGFTPEEAGKIGADYSQYNTTPGEYAGMTGDPNAPVRDLITNQQNLQGGMLNAYQGNLGAQLGQYSTNLGGAADEFGANTRGVQDAGAGDVRGAVGKLTSGADTAQNTGAGNVRGAYGALDSGLDTAQQTGAGNVRGAYGSLDSGLTDAQGKFGALNDAVNDPSLGFDPNGTEKQLTDTDVQNMRTSAGVSAGNQFRTAEDTLERQAAAQGNTSPAALAALRQQLVTQNAVTAGNVENDAEIAAKQAQFNRAQGIETQRAGAAQTQQGMRANAATTQEAAAQAAAGQSGQARISAEQQLAQQAQQNATTAGQAKLNAEQGISQQAQQNAAFTGQAGLTAEQQLAAQKLGVETNASQAKIDQANTIGKAALDTANNYGQFSTNEANTMTGQQLQAEQTAEQAAAQRAKDNAATKYSQGTGSQQLTSQGAQTIGNARQAGEGAYRTGVAQQQGLAQQGAQGATNAQLGAYGTQTTGTNSAANGQASFEAGKSSLGDSLGKGLSSLVGGLFAEGGVADRDMVATVGEHGPEMVLPPTGRYRPARPQNEDDEMFGMAA